MPRQWSLTGSNNTPTMYTSSRTSHRGFTLIELMLAMSIFAVMSIIITTVYINTTNTARKLAATRQLSEAAREITERLAQDVRERGIGDMTREFDISPGAYAYWTDQARYDLSGTEYLNIGSWALWSTYVYGVLKSPATIEPCQDTPVSKNKTDPRIHCGLYLLRGTEYYNLVDSFIGEESKKRIKIDDLRFYVSGNGMATKKVTLVMTLALMPRIGVPFAQIESTKLHIQTTISDRGWKK